MCNDTKNQHFVPQTYLNEFANSKGKCCVYNKKTKKFFETDVRNILAKRYYYDINFEELLMKIQKDVKLKEIPHRQILEKTFAICENSYRVIQENIKNNTQWFRIITNRFLVYQLGAIQLMRTPSGRKIIKESLEESIGKGIEPSFENILLLGEISKIIQCEEQEPISLELLLKNFGRLTIGINNSDIPFLTSDTPILFIDNYKKHGKQVVFYPITPTRCILLYEQIAVKHSQIMNKTIEKYKDYQGGILMSQIIDEANHTYKDLKNKLNPLEEVLSKDDVKGLNTCMFIKAQEYIVSNTPIESCDIFVSDLNNLNI